MRPENGRFSFTDCICVNVFMLTLSYNRVLKKGGSSTKGQKNGERPVGGSFGGIGDYGRYRKRVKKAVFGLKIEIVAKMLQKCCKKSKKILY